MTPQVGDEDVEEDGALPDPAQHVFLLLLGIRDAPLVHLLDDLLGPHVPEQEQGHEGEANASGHTRELQSGRRLRGQ